jgi:hypothetical protein
MHGMFKRLRVGALVGLLAGAAHADEQALHYEPAVVGLVGTIRMERHYGPPNFAPGSRVEDVPVLVLARPITVQGNPGSAADGDTYQHVTRVQLVGAVPARSDLSTSVGKRILATGRLFEKMFGGNFTDVLLDVQQIGPVPDGS